MTHPDANDITRPSTLTESGLQVEPEGSLDPPTIAGADPLELWRGGWKPRPGFVSLTQLVESVTNDAALSAQVLLEGETPKDAIMRVLSAGQAVAVGHTIHVTQRIPPHVWGSASWVINWEESMLYERRLKNADHMHFKVEVPGVKMRSQEEVPDDAGGVTEVRELGEPEITRVESDALPPGYHLKGLLVEDQVLAFQAVAADGSWHGPMTTRESDAIGQAWRHQGGATK